MAVRRLNKAAPLSVSRYELSGKVGTGCLGLVYRGRDVDSDALVAVQLIDPEIAENLKVIERIGAEFNTAVQYEHPNILRLLDFGQDGGFWYIVTEWVDGHSLSHMLQASTRLPEETTIRILTQIGQAVDYARLAGYSHCKVRPSNIVVRSDGVAKFIAFEPATGCVAARGRTEAPFNPTSSSFELPLNKNCTFPQILRSLGATLYEAATGQVWVEPPPPQPGPPGRRPRTRSSRPRTRLIGLSEKIDLAVKWATDPDPTKQPESCAEWLKVLRARSRTAATPRGDARLVTEDSDDRRAFVRYAVGVGSSCTIHTSLFDDCLEKTVSGDSDPGGQAAIWPLVVRDISAGGIGILLARRCEPGTELLIELVSGTNHVTRSLPVRVVRLRRDTFGHWIHGCEFFTPLEQPELTSVLGHLGRVDPS